MTASVRGNLFTVSAPSGAGKTSLVRAMLAALDGLVVSVSHTTRAMRPGEVDGENYHFVDQAEFDRMVSAGDFLEYARVFGNAYGTSKRWVEQQLATGRDVVLEIDWQGARQARDWLLESANASTVSIFVLPPSLATLQTRLDSRGQDDQQTIELRMAEAVAEMSHYQQSDYLIVNDLFDEAVADVVAVVRAARLRRGQQQLRHRVLLDELLGST